MKPERPSALAILVVDDHRDTVSALERLLSRRGHRVTSAESCDEAVDLAKAFRFDVVLCDIGMPVKDGFALLTALRAIYPVRVIALTGYAMQENVQQMTVAGFDGYVLKPVEWEQLRRALLGPYGEPTSVQDREEQSGDKL